MSTVTFIRSEDPALTRTTNTSDLQLIHASGELGVISQWVSHDSLFAMSSEIFGKGWVGNAKERVHCEKINVAESELIWIFGLGHKRSFLDRMQMLRSLPQDKFVNQIDALVYHHGKQGLLLSSLRVYHPITIVSDDISLLYDRYRQGGEWILKPTAGSFGKKVFLLPADDQDENVNELLRLATEDGFTLLQRRVDTRQEKRWLIANGKTIGVYGKQLHDHRGNLQSGSIPFEVVPSKLEQDRAAEVADALRSEGIRYAAIDIAHPYVLDVNFVNPGWLTTYETLTGKNKGTEVLEALLN